MRACILLALLHALAFCLQAFIIMFKGEQNNFEKIGHFVQKHPKQAPLGLVMADQCTVELLSDNSSTLPITQSRMFYRAKPYFCVAFYYCTQKIIIVGVEVVPHLFTRFSLLTLDSSIFFQPLSKISFHSAFVFYILCKMGKKIQKAGVQAKQLVVEHAPCPPPPYPDIQLNADSTKPQFLPHSKQGEENMVRQGRQEGSLLGQGVAKTMYFLNGQGYYSEMELDYYFICLANFIKINRQRIAITCNPELKNKIRKYLHRLTQEQHPSTPYTTKAKAIFYILVTIIYQKQQPTQKSKAPNKSIIADRNILSSILKIHLPKSITLSKLYGIIMLAITSKTYNRSTKQAIIRNILINLRNIQHQSTLFNLLVYLRGEKNKVKINLKDIQEGQVFPFLMLGYEKYIERYQSYYILDYLRYLLDLFPSMANTITAPFVGFLINNLRLMNMHHPMHEATILHFIQQGFKYLDANLKEGIVEQICRIQVQDIFTQAKIAKILIQNQTCQSLIKHITKQDYLMNFITCIQSGLQRNTVISCIQVLIAAITKLSPHSMHLCRYLVYLLRERVSVAGMMDSEIDKLIKNAESGHL